MTRSTHNHRPPPPPPPPPPPRPRHAGITRAFTLVELVVSMAVLSIVMSALMSTMLLSLKALPDADDTGLIGEQADAALEMLMADAMLASSIAVDGTALKLIVPDQTGDAAEDVVLYALEDANLNPTVLIRTLNARTPRTLVRRISAFSFTITSTDGAASLLTAELVTGRGKIHRASVELLTRPGGS